MEIEMKFGGDSRFFNLLVPREISSSLEWKVSGKFYVT